MSTAMSKARVFLGTILLERNRWGKEGRGPSYLVSDWTQRISDDGFDGLELWQDHAFEATNEELERLRTGPSPVTLFNSYANCDDDGLAARKRTAELASYFGCEGMKFNFGKSLEQKERYIENVREWSALFMPGYRMLSENHRGTITADADVAASVYASLGDLPVGGIIHFGNDEATYRERFTKYGDRLTHIHCALSTEEGPMPESEVRLRVAWLREFGFSGTYTIEFTEGVRGQQTIDELYRNAVRDFRMLRKCLADD